MSAAQQGSLSVIGYSGRVAVAKQFSIQALIPAKPSGKPVVLYGWCARRKVKMTARIGAVAKNREHDDGEGLCPSLHIDLWQLILALLTLWAERPLGQNHIHPSFNEVWRRYSGSKHRPSVNQREAIAKLWDELDGLRMLVQIPGESDRLVDVVHYETTRLKINTGLVSATSVASFSFDERFLEVVRYAHETQDIRLDVLNQVSSRLVRAAYLWLPVVATRNPPRTGPVTPEKFTASPALRLEVSKISSKEFFVKLGHEDIPRSRRKQLLTQNDSSILHQLHGLPLLRQGVMLGVAGWDEEDDFYIGAYTFSSSDWAAGTSARRRPEASRDTLLFKAFVDKGGGDPSAYFYWINHAVLPKADDYQIDRLREYGVDNIDGSMSFFRMVLALIGPDDFTMVVGWLSEARVNKSAGGLFRTMLLEHVAKVAVSRSKLYAKIAGEAESQPELPLN